ncbi:tyrosine-type recombinase/integrase [Microbacterium sp. RU33B]|uniref:tyrosine-type recombinase/integrase n=1 Tax=Microbacterium sp. RU33B TaxID=1907390 RepID=UPI000964DBCB|nr:tyrosine-type recombinase/integrase [Microbacterium sp. RU33B]SIT72499.1 Integrase [Microbacterium sp. RU33B]
MARPQLEPGTHGKVSLRLRGSTWQARASGRTLGGEPLDLTGKGATPEEATEALDRAFRELTFFADAQLTENSTIAMAIDAWLVNRQAAVSAGMLKPQSYEKYVSSSRSVKKALGALPLHEARARVILPYLEQLVIKRGAARGRAFRMVLRGAFDTAISREAMSHDPLVKAPAYRSATRVQPSLTKEQFGAMRKSIQSWGEHPRRRSDWRKLLGILDVSMGTSLRIGEVLAIRPVDIFLEDGQPMVDVNGTIVEVEGRLTRQPIPKHADQERVIPLPTPVALTLGELASRVGPRGLLFGTRSGEPDGNPNRLIKAWRKSVEGQEWMREVELNAHQVTFKLMRRSAATQTRKRMGTEAASTLLGHKYTSTTEGHYSTRPRVDVETARVLEEMWETSA